MSVLSSIRSQLCRLPLVLRSVAQFVLTHPLAAATSTMHRVAAKSHSSPATLTRFAQHFSYPSWSKFKAALVLELAISGSTNQQQRAPIQHSSACLYHNALLRLGLADSPELRVLFWDQRGQLDWHGDSYITPSAEAQPCPVCGVTRTAAMAPASS
ncbi:MurR/RpiR family transcriptional regulator [Pseudorhodoferax sp. Leaf267]|uniref:MurR/RpiR family transcriptional regulator n=1 Tax=Pseudorhodoferax sp. Leaf267 TaxID=1736316 RepID=UPI00138F6782